MNILLTGATGFIGSAFAAATLARGHSLAGLILPTEQPPPRLSAHPNARWIRGTLQTASSHEIEAFKPEVCVHTAWIATPGVYLESPENIRFKEQSLEFLQKVIVCGARHVVSLGTCIEYQKSGRPLSEETLIAPTTTYARCKNELRLALEEDAAKHGYTFCWARVFYPYGPGEHPSRLCSSIIERLRRDEAVFLKTPNSTKDYIFIADVASALLTVVEKSHSGPINIGTGVGASVAEIARALANLLGKPQLVKENPAPEADPFPYVVSDATRLRSLGWHPAFDLNGGLGELLASRSA